MTFPPSAASELGVLCPSLTTGRHFVARPTVRKNLLQHPVSGLVSAALYALFQLTSAVTTHVPQLLRRPPCIAVICSTHLLPLRNPNLNPVLDDCRDSLTPDIRCLPWSTWRRPRPTRRRVSSLSSLQRPLRWHVEQTYVRVLSPASSCHHQY